MYDGQLSLSLPLSPTTARPPGLQQPVPVRVSRGRETQPPGDRLRPVPLAGEQGHPGRAPGQGHQEAGGWVGGAGLAVLIGGTVAPSLLLLVLPFQGGESMLSALARGEIVAKIAR